MLDLSSLSIDDVKLVLAEKSLVEFLKQSWHVLEPATPYVHGWHIDAICEHLEAVTLGQIRNLVINMPPRHAKSILVAVAWPCWVWTRFPAKRWMFASYAQSLSIRDSLKCRRLVKSDWYQKNWGDKFQLCGDQDAKIKFENTATGCRLATSVDAAVTGEGGDFLVADDPHNVRQAESEARREAVLDWWDQSMSTRGNDPKTVAKVIVMQRVHEKDLSGHVLGKDGYVHLCLPARYEGKRLFSTARPEAVEFREDPRRELRDLLWSDRFGEPELATLEEDLGTYGAAGQLQQRPAPAEGGIFKREWWRRYRELPNLEGKVIHWDTAVSKKDGSAFSCGQVWGWTRTDYYLVDLIRERMEYPELKQAVKDLDAKHNPTCTYVEDKSSGQQVVQDLKRDTRLAIIGVGVTDGDKIVRARLASPTVEAGKVWLPEDAPWVSDFLLEATAFPNAAYADQVDTLSQAISQLKGVKSGVTSGRDMS